MKKFQKKNNKGFSLVELIVVVLIMAIIAVALAPQVMKWVENSRQATDVSNYDAMIANAQLALTDKNAFDSCKAITFTITIGSANTTTSLTGAAKTNFENAMNNVAADWATIARKAGTTDYVISVANGSVSKTASAPNGNIS